MKQAGCEIKTGKRISIKPPQSKKFFRLDKLGEDYSYDAILERLSGKRNVATEIKPQNKPNLLIDIQAKIAEGKGAGYEHWAKIFNLKQLSKTLIFLKEKGIEDYDDLVSKSSEMSAQTHELNEKIHDIDSRLKEISELQKHIGTYGKRKKNSKLGEISRTNRGRRNFTKFLKIVPILFFIRWRKSSLTSIKIFV